jgi:molecular chaperone DnaK
LGTTYSVVSIIGPQGKPEILPNREGERITPSVVMFTAHMTLVGSMAQSFAATSPDDVVQFVKRMMGDRSWRFTTTAGEQYGAEEVSAVILRRLKEDAEIALGEPVTDAVITVPAYFDDARRMATKDAGEIAGLHVLRVLNEPTAAALAFGLGSQATGTILVYDLGGGTFDVTILRVSDGEFDVIATMGDRNLGGFNWDNELINYVTNEVKLKTGIDITDDDLKMAELRDKAVLAKRMLTTMPETQIFLEIDEQVLHLPIARELFAELTRGLLSRTQDITELALEEAGLTWPDLDHLLLVGGSTRMPMVQEMIVQRSGQEPVRGVNPDEVVALGAAIQGHLLTLEAGGPDLPELAGANGRDVSVLDVAALGLGVVALDPVSGLRTNYVLVPHNSKVPAKGSEVFATIHDRQREVSIEITEGDDDDIDFIKILGRSVFNLPAYPSDSPIRVDISFDFDAVIHAEVFDHSTGLKLGDLKIERESNLTRRQVAAAANQIRRLEIH